MKLQFLNPVSKVVTSSCNCHSKIQLLINSDDHEAYSSSQRRSTAVPNNLFQKSCYSSKKENDDDDTFLIKPFHNVQIRTNKNKKNDIVLEDTLMKTPIAVCRMRYSGLKPCKIYTTTPNYQGQKASKQTYTSSKSGNATIALYTYGDITISNGNRSNPIFTLVLTGNCSLGDEAGDCVTEKRDDRKYTITSIGTFQRGVLNNGRHIALMESKLKSVKTCCGTKSYTSYTRITVTPDIDPCLMICLSAICSYIDNSTVHE